ncbi:hypothetical protein LINGRAHAP2_LOCUS6876 [Linum grandiflorum]
MRIRVRLDIRKSLQREKSMKKPHREVLAKFKYEKLPTFCFLCGRIGHIDRYCPIRWRFPEGTELVKLWDEPLRAPVRRAGKEFHSPYLIPSAAEKRAAELRVGVGSGRMAGVRPKPANIQELARNFRTCISPRNPDGSLDSDEPDAPNDALVISEERKKRKLREGRAWPMEIDNESSMTVSVNDRQGSKNLVLAGSASETCPPQ